jgi:hypothetical protein
VLGEDSLDGPAQAILDVRVDRHLGRFGRIELLCARVRFVAAHG